MHASCQEQHHTTGRALSSILQRITCMRNASDGVARRDGPSLVFSTNRISPNNESLISPSESDTREEAVNQQSGFAVNGSTR